MSKKLKIATLTFFTILPTLLSAQNTELTRVKELIRELQAEVVRLEAEQVVSAATTTTSERSTTVVNTATATTTVATQPSANYDIFPDQTIDQEHIADLQKQQPQRISTQATPKLVEPIDTLPTGSDRVKIILYNDNSWRYERDRAMAKDQEIYTRYWDTVKVQPYRDEVTLSRFPEAMAIDLVDSLSGYHYPYKGKIHPNGKFGPRRRRNHRGIDLPLKTGDPIYATFNGRVRISQYNYGGYGHLVVIRHDNGLETYYGHLSERMVTPGQWVEAGQIIGLGGSTGRSTGPHLHYETRFYGQTFDPERIIDFETGDLRRETIVLKRSYFDIHSNAEQDFEAEFAADEADKKAAEAKAAMRYHTVRSGDTLSGIAKKYGTTVTNICRLNGIKSTSVLRIGKTLRVR